MTQLESQAGATDALRRNRLPGIELPGVTERLAVPGLEVEPPVSDDARVADGILQAFSALGGASAAIVRQRAIEEQNQQERDRIAQANAREVEVADRGLSNQYARQDLPEFVSKIQSGELAPDEGESVRDFVSRIAREGTEGQSEAYINQRERAIGDSLASALQQRRDLIRNQAEADNAALAVKSIYGATDPAKFTEAVGAARKFRPGLTQQVAEDEVGQAWLDNAVQLAGTNPEQASKVLAAARSTLGDRLGTEQLVAQNRFDAFIKQDRNEKLDDLKSIVGKMLDRNTPYSTVLAFISEQGERLGIDVYDIKRQVDTEHNVLHNRRESDAAQAARARDKSQQSAEEAAANAVADKLLAGDFGTAERIARDAPQDVSRQFVLGLVNQVQSHASRAARESAEQVKSQEKFAFTNSALTNASAMVESGLGNLIEDATGVASDGTMFNIKGSELREQAMTAKFAAIADRFKDDPKQARVEQIRVAAQNAYYPGGWKSLINGAAAKTTTAVIATSKDGTLSPDAMEGYRFYKQLSAQAPGLLDSMNLDSRTKELFTAASVLESTPLVGGNPVAALTSAASIVDDPATFLDSVRLSAISRSLNIRSQGDLEIARDAAPFARLFARLGKTPEDAVATAIEQVEKHRIKINGWSSRIGNVPPQLRYQFADVAKSKIDAVAKAVKGTGLDRRDLAIRYNDQNDLWQIVQRDTGLAVVTDDPDETFFTTSELVNEAVGIREAEAKAKYDRRN